MTVAIAISTAGAIDSYPKLVAAVADELDRNDLDNQIPRFIRLAEARMTRLILHPDRDASVTIATVAGEESVALPADMRRLRSAHVVADPLAILQQVSPSELRASWNTGSGQPQAFAIHNGRLVLGPVPDGVYTISLAYIGTIAPLTDANQSNWLLLKHPDAYLYGALLHAEAYLANDDRLTLWKSVFDEAIAEINQEGNRYRYSASPLRLRNPVCA